MRFHAKQWVVAALAWSCLTAFATCAVAVPPEPTCAAVEVAERATLSTSDAVNEVAREVWVIEDETINSRKFVNLVLGVAAAYGGWVRNEDKSWEGRIFVAPTAAARFGKRQVARAHIVERDRARLNRLQNIVLPKIIAEVSEELKRVEEQVADLKESLAKSALSQEDASAPQSDPSPPPVASEQKSNQDGAKAGSFRTALERSLKRELTALDRRRKDLAQVREVAQAWRARACRLNVTLTDASFALLGGELMMGYAFDVLTNPDDGPKSAVIGGAGANLSVGGFAFGVGGFLHEAGIIGVYLDVGVPIAD